MSSALEDIAGSEACDESQDSESITLVKTESPTAASDSTPPGGTPQRQRKASTCKRKARAKRQKTYLDPSLMLSPINQKGSVVCTGLVNLPLWQQFSSLGTEMLVNKRGRRMFPSVDITVTGLNPSAKYMMIMDVVPVSNWRYKYVEQEWVVSRPSTGAPFTDYFVHPKSPALGVDWMEEDISFGGMKLTNLEERSDGMIRVHTMHCYQPRLHIVEGESVGEIINSEKTHFFLFPATYFFPVTSYMNEKVIDLKVKYNKYAKAFISTREAVTEGRRLRKESVSSCSSSIDESGPSHGAKHNLHEVPSRQPNLGTRGVPACSPPNGMHVYTPQALGMNSTPLKFLRGGGGGGRGGGRCLSIPSGGVLPVTSMSQPPLAGTMPLQDPLLQGHPDQPSQQQDTSLACNTPTPPPGVMYPSGSSNSWPPLGNSTGLQPLAHTESYSEDVSPVTQSTSAAVDLPRLGEEAEGASGGLQSPSSKGSGMSSMEGRGGPCTPLCLATSQPSSEPAVNDDTSVTMPHQQQDNSHSIVMGNQALAASATLPAFSHMAPIPQFPISSTAGIPRNVNSSLHPVYFTNFQFVAGSSDRVKGDSLPLAGHGTHPYASSDLQSLPVHSSEEHFPPIGGGALQSGLIGQSNSLGTMDLHPWALASCKQRLLSPETEDECELNSNSCTSDGTDPQEKQSRLCYQNSPMGVPSNGCLWTPLYVANYHSQLQQYNHHSTLPGHNSSSLVHHQPLSYAQTSTSDYPLQTEPSSMQSHVLCNLQRDKTASLAMQGANVVQSELNTAGNDVGDHTPSTSQLSQWALHMSKGMDTGSRLQVMPAFGLLPTYNGLSSISSSAHNC